MKGRGKQKRGFVGLALDGEAMGEVGHYMKETRIGNEIRLTQSLDCHIITHYSVGAVPLDGCVQGTTWSTTFPLFYFYHYHTKKFQPLLLTCLCPIP